MEDLEAASDSFRTTYHHSVLEARGAEAERLEADLRQEAKKKLRALKARRSEVKGARQEVKRLEDGITAAKAKVQGEGGGSTFRSTLGVHGIGSGGCCLGGLCLELHGASRTAFGLQRHDHAAFPACMPVRMVHACRCMHGGVFLARVHVHCPLFACMHACTHVCSWFPANSVIDYCNAPRSNSHPTPTLQAWQMSWQPERRQRCRLKRRGRAGSERRRQLRGLLC